MRMVSRSSVKEPSAWASGRFQLPSMTGARWLPCMVPWALPLPSSMAGGKDAPCSQRAAISTLQQHSRKTVSQI